MSHSPIHSALTHSAPEETTELQYVYRVHDDEDEAVNIATTLTSESPISLTPQPSIMDPHWFPLDQIPYDNMPADDREWYVAPVTHHPAPSWSVPSSC